MLTVAALSIVLGASVEPPSNQTLLFYNARLALREGKAPEALKLWLLRNVVAKGEGHVGRYDRDLKSVTWAALGALGLCGDGFSKDTEGGAGLWPLAVHNQVVLTLVKGPVQSPQNPADAFEVGRQQRFVSMNDVLDPAELRTVTFFRTSCVEADSTMLSMGKFFGVDPTDRLATAPVMRAETVTNTKPNITTSTDASQFPRVGMPGATARKSASAIVPVSTTIIGMSREVRTGFNAVAAAPN